MHDIPKDAKIVIIRMQPCPVYGQSGVYAMETAIKDLQAQGVKVLMTIIQPQPRYMLENHRIIPCSSRGEHLRDLRGLYELYKTL